MQKISRISELFTEDMTELLLDSLAAWIVGDSGNSAAPSIICLQKTLVLTFPNYPFMLSHMVFSLLYSDWLIG